MVGIFLHPNSSRPRRRERPRCPQLKRVAAVLLALCPGVFLFFVASFLGAFVTAAAAAIGAWARKIARQGGHKPVGGFPRRAHLISVIIAAPRCFYQLAQGHLGTAGLAGEPFPVARQQGYLPRHDTQPGPATFFRWGLGFGFFSLGRRQSL